MPAVVDPEACTGCETCVAACPAVAITMKGDRAKTTPGSAWTSA